jgi:predicted DNA-binding transcriptional regulator YafY
VGGVRADRLLAIILLLQTRGRQTASQLAAEARVSVRTIYRDVVALSAAGIPIYADPTGYRLVAGFRTELTGLTEAEARGLVLAELPDAAAELGLAPTAAAVRLKLSAALPEALRAQAARMRQRLHFDAPGWYADGDRSDHLAAVAEAVWSQHVVDVRYDAWGGVVQRRLEPYGLVLKAGRWYVVASVDAAVRTFRVNQILELTVRPERFERPEEFDLAGFWRAHIAEFRERLYRGEALVRLAPQAIPSLAHLLGRAVAEAAQRGEPGPDGWLVAHIPIESESHAERELLRLGAQVEVLEPASLRQRIARTVAALSALYPGSVPSPDPGHQRHRSADSVAG